MTLYAEKLLPHDIEAEEAVIGSLLIDGECFSRLAPVLQGADFYRERNQLCYDAAMALFLRDQAIDQTTMAGELARTERLDSVGGMAYLSHLVAITPTSAHAEDYAENVQRTSTMRKLIAAAARISELGYNDTDDVEGTLRQAEDALFAVRGAGQTRGFVPLRQIYDQYLQDRAGVIEPLVGFDGPGNLGIQRAGRAAGRHPAVGHADPGCKAVTGQEHAGLEHLPERRQERFDRGVLQPGDEPGTAGHAHPVVGG